MSTGLKFLEKPAAPQPHCHLYGGQQWGWALGTAVCQAALLYPPMNRISPLASSQIMNRNGRSR
jgi:hypothetical protein